ncbi:hypothetical protein M8J77_023502 [Diaphorina citri]|nr:hypothetical protein M8J77_023502 [Diaphorina citri]
MISAVGFLRNLTPVRGGLRWLFGLRLCTTDNLTPPGITSVIRFTGIGNPGVPSKSWQPGWSMYQDVPGQ